MGGGFQKTTTQHVEIELDAQVDICRMVEDAFQHADESMALEERTIEIVEKEFMVVNGLPREVAEGYNNGEGEVPTKNSFFQRKKMFLLKILKHFPIIPRL